MKRYLGMDVHAASSTIAVVGESGRLLRRLVVETNGRALVEAIRMIPGTKHLCFEEGTQSAWLYETLSPHVESTTVTSVSYTPGKKCDAIDAEGLANKLRLGTLDRKVFKAPRQFTMLRELAKVHATAVRDRVRVQARIKAVYRSRGVSASGKMVYNEKHREEWQKKLPIASRKTVSCLYEHYDFLRDLESRGESELVTESHRHAISHILETCPGLGPIRVARLMPVVVTPHRFRTKQQFWSYVGLGIVTRSSSDWVKTNDGWQRANVQRTRGLNPRSNSALKDIFKGAATTVITKLHNNPMYADYQRILEGDTKPNLAKLTIARKVAATVLRMWKNEEKYDPEKYRTKSTAVRS